MKLIDYIDSNAFDIAEKYPFVVEYKTPNTFAKKGYCDNAKFLAAEFGTALAAELGWKLESDEWKGSEVCRIYKGNLIIMIRTRTYGANAYKQIALSGYVHTVNDGVRNNSKSVSINVTSKKGIATIAKDVERRIFPELNKIFDTVSTDNILEAERIARLVKKTAQLAKAYPNLKVSLPKDQRHIDLVTKHGGNIYLAANVRENLGGTWTLRADNHGFSIDDIDRKSGKAMLRAIDKN